MNVSELMKKPIVIERDVNLADAAKLMIKHAMSSLIVVFDEKISGVITHEDIVRHFGENKKVSEVMTKQVITVKQTDRAQKALELIRERRISVLPVVDKYGKLIGVVHTEDLLNKVCDSDEFLMG